MNYQRILDEIDAEVRKDFGNGKVASYIPALKRVSPKKFGMAVMTVDGDIFTVGDAEEPFSIQSISKVFTLSLELNALGSGLWQRVGREPSGDPFNSLVQLEHERGVPRNPFINTHSQCLPRSFPRVPLSRERRSLPDQRAHRPAAPECQAHQRADDDVRAL